MNQFVVRIFDLNENLTDAKLLPKHEYTLDKSTKYYQIDSSNIRMQYVVGKNMILNGKLFINWITATKSKNTKIRFSYFRDLRSFFFH